MKNILLFLSTIVCTNSFAQLSLGILGGAHQSVLYNKMDKAADKRLDYINTYKTSFGFCANYSLTKRLFVNASPQIFNAGQKFKIDELYPFPGTYFNGNVDISIKYLQMPLQIGYTFGGEKKLKHKFSFGGYLGNVVDSKYRLQSNYGPIGTDYSTEVVEYIGKNVSASTTYTITGVDSIFTINGTLERSLFNKIDYGVLGSYQLDYQINQSLSIFTSIKYQLGLAQVEYVDSIKAVENGNPNSIGYYSLKDRVYCRDNYRQIQPGDKLREPKSNNIFIGIQFGLVYHFKYNQKSKK